LAEVRSQSELQGKKKDRNLVGGLQERASNEPSGALLPSLVTGVVDYAMSLLLIGATAQGSREKGCRTVSHYDACRPGGLRPRKETPEVKRLRGRAILIC